MTALVTSAGGEEVNEKNKGQADMLLLEESKDKKVVSSFKNKAQVPFICSVDVVTNGILQQKLEPERYSLIK